MMQNRIKELRQKQGITQVELASIVGLSSVQIGYLERGMRRINDIWIEIISSALHVKPLDLFISSAKDQPLNHMLLKESITTTVVFFKQKNLSINQHVPVFVDMTEQLYGFLYNQHHQSLSKKNNLSSKKNTNKISKYLNDCYQKQRMG